MKDAIKKYFPITILGALAIEYSLDYFRYLKHSGVLQHIWGKEQMLLGSIIADYHVIEKGLTMPDSRLGFGKAKVVKLIDLCTKYINKYGTNSVQLLQGVAVVLEYETFHIQRQFSLDSELIGKISKLKDMIPQITASEQITTTSELYFSDLDKPFEQFVQSRKSIRNYSNVPVPIESIMSAVKIAGNSPSSCNRQSTRVHIYENKDVVKQILELQGGNRGFGHLADKVVIVTAELGACHGVYERNMAYVDGGIFATNLLNGLHLNKVVACPLNCYFSAWKDSKLRKICKISPSEVFIVMISCGNPPEEFKVAVSHRYLPEMVVNVHRD